MKRLLALLCFVLFVVGVLIVPAVHKIHLGHCDSCADSQSHNPDTCVVCVVGAMAVTVACVFVAVVLTQRPFELVNISSCFLIDRFIPKSHPARAPPFA